MIWDVFISYSKNDKEIATRIAELLEKRLYHITIWFDDSNLIIGEKYKTAIEIGLKFSRFGLIIFSENYFQDYKKSLKQKEFEHFNPWIFTTDTTINKKEKNILPVWYGIDEKYVNEKLKELAIPGDITSIQAATIKENDNASLNSAINKIVQAITILPKIKKPIQKTLPYEGINTFQLGLHHLPEDWEILKNYEAGDRWANGIKLFNKKEKITLISCIQYYNTIDEAIKDFKRVKDEQASKEISRILSQPKIGEESYGYERPGVSLTIFRICNLLIRIEYWKSSIKPSMIDSAKYAHIVDRNIRLKITKDEIDSIH